MTEFVITHYLDDRPKQLSLPLTENLIYAEDIVIELAKTFDINPILRHLFGLYHRNNKIWLSSNQLLSQWTESKTLDFRLRFRPKHINVLKLKTSVKTVDYKALHYCFNQIRNDFICGHFECENINKIYGLVVTNMVRDFLKSRITNLDKISDEFVAYLPHHCKKPKFFMSKITEAFNKGLTNCQQYLDPIVFIEETFIEDFITSLRPNYWTESYNVMYDKRIEVKRPHLMSITVEYRHQAIDDEPTGILCKNSNDTNNEWTHFCSISDIGFISLDSNTKTVEISRTTGVPFSLMFQHDLQMKSFVSLLDGYYRLSVKWSFSICKDISSPSLAKLRKHKTHGPVDYNFVLNKFKDRANDTAGAYILRESGSKYDEYKLDVYIGHEMFETFKVRDTSGQIVVEAMNRSSGTKFESLTDLIKSFSFYTSDEREISLSHCITPSEHDLPSNLLLCRLDTKDTSSDSTTESLGPPVVSAESLKLTHTTLTNNSRYGIRLATLKDKQYIVKELKNEELTKEFLRTVSQWTHLRNDSTIVVCRGITIWSPLSMLLEYLPLGSLDSFLKQNKSNLKPINLIESTSYLSRALWYLYENGVVHGHIRCHNLLVSEYADNCLKVKLSDPISDNDINTERVWLPPEYLSAGNDSHLFQRLTHSVDVWAFGTTVWQIFSYGLKPNSENIFELIQPKDCPNEIWTLIGECWTLDSGSRKQPHSIWRDVNQILYEVFNSKRNDYYSKPVFDEPKPTKPAVWSLKNWAKYKPNALFNSNFSLSSGSITSAQSASTYLANSISNETTIGSQMEQIYGNGEFVANGFDGATNHSNELPWIIESHQIKMGKVIGTGCYGEVLKATLTMCAGLKEEVVAVKRIKAVSTDRYDLRDMKREIEIMKKLSHKNIVEIKGFVEDSTDPQTMLVMEFVELGSLALYLTQNQTDKSVVPLIQFATDICSGMEYLESKSIVHRDLAARNILVASPEHVKISDFGLAQFIDPNNQYYTIKTNRELPLRWYAIESLKFGKFSHKSDVWSFGVVLWEMYSYGAVPQFEKKIGDSDLLQALEANIRLPLPSEDCPLRVYQIMLSCWNKDSHLRPGFSQLRESIEESVH